MKRLFYIFICLLVGVMGLQSFAEVVTERKINRPTQNPTPVQKTKPVDNLSENMKTCKPYSERMKADYLGMNVNYKISIDGWVNNKCVVNFSAETSGISSSFQSLYGIDPSEASVSVFAPKIRCEFTKEQLAYVGDSILQENERNAGATNNMLKNPNGIDLSGLSNAGSSDAKLMEVIVGNNACNILNGGDLGNMLQGIMGGY